MKKESMKDLKRKINYLDREINAEKSLLKQETHVMFDFIQTTKFLYPAMVVSFGIGFFIAHKPSVAQAARGKFRKLPGFIATLIKNVQLVLPLIL